MDLYLGGIAYLADATIENARADEALAPAAPFFGGLPNQFHADGQFRLHRFEHPKAKPMVDAGDLLWRVS